MRALAVAFFVALALPSAASAAPLTATQIRVADHPGFVRVVVDFSGGAVQFNELEATDPDPFADGFVRIRLLQDRKSTRLNSSHMSNSYAVFFLKKKKTSAELITLRPGSV